MSASSPLALLGREGLWGMIGVEKIGEIRRAYFKQHRSIKEIVRTLSVSRVTVRKVVRGHQTEFKYERGVQPSPKLGAWVEVLTEIQEQEVKLPKRELDFLYLILWLAVALPGLCILAVNRRPTWTRLFPRCRRWRNQDLADSTSHYGSGWRLRRARHRKSSQGSTANWSLS